VDSFDLLIVNGQVLDGTGNPPLPAAVGVVGDELRIVRGSATELLAGRVIDAAGHVVAPGFIDLHSHSGLVLMAEPDHMAKVRQGVTTEVVGVDGCSYAPFRSSADLEMFVRLNAGLDGRPNVPYNWNSVADYLTRFDLRISLNVAMLIGNSALRVCAIGWEDRPPNTAEMEDMRALIREGMEEGAFGISTGLDYPPGAHASTEELTALSTESARHGGMYHTHVRYQFGDRYLDPFREALEIGRGSGCPIHLTHLYRRATMPGGSGPMLDLVDEARAEGMDVTFDTYPYEWSSTRLLILMPLWVQEGGPDRILERLSDPTLRERIRQDVDARGASYAGESVWGTIRLGHFRDPDNAQFEGATLAEVMEARQQHPADAMIDLLISEDLGVNEVAPGPHGPSMAAFIKHPAGMVGSDSVFIGDKPSPRTYGSFPRILGEFVRDERVLGLSEAIRKMTSFAALRLGLVDRGLLKDGFKADIVVFDPATVRATATYARPKQFPEGIPYVAVNGQLVVDGGRHTGAHPGRALRHGRPT
jgi:N-acyl-D-amino-acid deacylase